MKEISFWRLLLLTAMLFAGLSLAVCLKYSSEKIIVLSAADSVTDPWGQTSQVGADLQWGQTSQVGTDPSALAAEAAAYSRVVVLAISEAGAGDIIQGINTAELLQDLRYRTASRLRNLGIYPVIADQEAVSLANSLPGAYYISLELTEGEGLSASYCPDYVIVPYGGVNLADDILRGTATAVGIAPLGLFEAPKGDALYDLTVPGAGLMIGRGSIETRGDDFSRAHFRDALAEGIASSIGRTSPRP